MSGKRLNVLNLETARFECVFPRCGGACCKGSRPPCSEEEAERIASVLPRVLPGLRPAARKRIEKDGFVTRRIRSGHRMLAVVANECVFHTEGGCALHRLGLEDGDAFMYKPWVCSAFPLDRDGEGSWFVRQHGYMGEEWDLFCLSPTESDVPASESLRTELAFVARIDRGER